MSYGLYSPVGGGGSGLSPLPISSNTTLTPGCLALVDTTGGAVTVTLPSPALEGGLAIVVQDVGGSALANNITVARFGSEKINGQASSKVLSTAYGRLTFYSNGTDWYAS